MEAERSTERARMVAEQLVPRGISDAGVLRAMGEVPREEFVPSGQARFAYADGPLPIAEGQTISQPYIVALMTEALRLGPGDRVLEVGAGSGYGAAVLSRVAKEVHTVERHPLLALAAKQRLARLGHANVRVHVGDGTLGWPAAAPYDGISVTAGGPSVPDALFHQLAVGGRLVIPVGPRNGAQRLLRFVRTADDRLERDDLGAVQFVPLVGAGLRSSDEAPR